MPSPVSCTLISGSSSAAESRTTTAPPELVNLQALETRLQSTLSSFSGSTYTRGSVVEPPVPA